MSAQRTWTGSSIPVWRAASSHNPFNLYTLSCCYDCIAKMKMFLGWHCPCAQPGLALEDEDSFAGKANYRTPKTLRTTLQSFAIQLSAIAFLLRLKPPKPGTQHFELSLLSILGFLSFVSPKENRKIINFPAWFIQNKRAKCRKLWYAAWTCVSS